MVRFVALILVTSLSCRSATDAMRSEEHNDKTVSGTKPDAGAEVIAPNHCRISATVISIDTVYRSGDLRDPCSKAPCHASLRVESVLGYGQAFARPLSPGDTLLVVFEFTVAPTKDVLPTMATSYPGVRVGTRILADVLASQSLSTEQSLSFSYSVFGYSVR